MASRTNRPRTAEPPVNFASFADGLLTETASSLANLVVTREHERNQKRAVSGAFPEDYGKHDGTRGTGPERPSRVC